MKIRHGLTLLALLASAGWAQAQDALQVRSWAAACACAVGM